MFGRPKEICSNFMLKNTEGYSELLPSFFKDRNVTFGSV